VVGDWGREEWEMLGCDFGFQLSFLIAFFGGLFF
jgi:hypothetical protein